MTIHDLETNAKYLGKYLGCPFYQLNGKYYFVTQDLFPEVYERTWETEQEIKQWLETWVLPDE